MEQISQKPQRPNNNLALAIISTIACCMPLGIVSIIYSTKVNTEYDKGNYEGAEAASKSAKTWGIAAIATGVVAIVLYIIFMVVFAASNGFDGY